MYSRDIEVAGTFNLRDLGGYAAAHGQTTWRNILRSASLADLGPSGQAQLRALGITRVIDLRSVKERALNPDRLGEPAQIELVEISLFDDLDPGRLSGDNLLLALYLEMLRTKGSVLVEVLRQIATAPGPVLFHCTAGKDRTGVVAALVLGLVGVGHEDIISDYALTADRIGPLREKFAKIAETMSLDPAKYEAALDCRAETMAQTLTWIEQNYTSVAQYLQKNGLSGDHIAQIERRLVTPLG